jgi:mycothiol synthase
LEMVIRTALNEDLDRIANLCAEALTSDADEAARLPELLWESPTGRPDLKLVAEEDQTIVGAALAALRVEQDGPPAGYIDLLAVAPAAQRRGYGRSLLARAEEVLKRLGAVEVRLGGNAPCYAWPGIDLNYTAAIELAESSGYEPWYEAFNMSVDLNAASLDTTTAERRFAESGIAIRPLANSDEPHFSSWVAEHWNADWAWEATRALVRTQARCYVATRGSDVIAFAACGAGRPSWFGPMGTVPAEQRQGLGAILLKRCLTDQRSAGMSRSFIAWVGPAEFYNRSVGAEVDRVFRLFKKVV